MPRPTTAIYVVEIANRPNGSVRVHRPAEGKNSFRVTWRDRRGRQRERTTTALDEAKSIAEQVARSLLEGTQVEDVPDPTLGDLIDFHLWGPGRPKTWRSEHSGSRVEQILRRVIDAEDLDLRVSDLCGPDGQVELDRIMDRGAKKRGLTPGTAEYAKTGSTIRRLFEVARDHELIALPHGNPMRHVRYRLNEYDVEGDPRLLTVHYVGEEERPSTDRVLEFVDMTRKLFGEREALYVKVLAFGGLRPGEANALRPIQIRRDRPGILVNRQIVELSGTERALSPGPSLRTRLPKWARIRNAWVTDSTHESLLALADEMSRQGRSNDVMFPTHRGAWRRQGNWRRDVFSPVARQVNWPSTARICRGRPETHWDWSVYAFRHHYANYLLKDVRESLATVSKYMGHKDMRVTERMYLVTELSSLDETSRLHAKTRWAHRA